MITQTFKACTAVLSFAGFSSIVAQESQSKPNIIFILADDLGYGDVSCYNPYSKISTPNIDRLAANGMRFTDAHSGSALSTPTRYSLLTGRYSFRSRIKSGVLNNESEPLIEADRMTVGRFLQTNGYHTACFGKWHLGVIWARNSDNSINYNGRITEGPATRGFDYYFGVNQNNSTFFIENDRIVEAPTVPKPDGMYGGAGLMAPGWTYENLLPTLTSRVIDYIKNTSCKRDSENPFFIYYAANAPHTPIAPTDEFKGTSNAHLYGDFIQQLDNNIGQIMKALEDMGIVDNTLVIVSSDNGPMHWDGTNMQGGSTSIFKYGHNPSYPLRGKKSDIWEAGHRVPFVVHWPAQIPSNTVNDELISQIDFMATCAGILGVTLPEGVGEDSYNMLSVLKGKNTAPIRKELVNHSGRGMFALRQGNWKFILAGGSGGFTAPQTDTDAEKLGLPPIQLYDMASDPEETTNLYDRYPQKVTELKQLLNSIIQ